jgi:hypothetical protein
MGIGDTSRLVAGKRLVGLCLQAIAAMDHAMPFAIGARDVVTLKEEQAVTEAGRTDHVRGTLIVSRRFRPAQRQAWFVSWPIGPL